MTGFERIFLFAAILSVLLLISSLDLDKYAGKYLSRYFKGYGNSGKSGSEEPKEPIQAELR
jgi:hypothetical protein